MILSGLRVFCSPVADEAVNAIMLVDVFIMTSCTGNLLFFFAKEGLNLFHHSVSAGVWHNTSQTIHLPEIPRNDIGNVVMLFSKGALPNFA